MRIFIIVILALIAGSGAAVPRLLSPRIVIFGDSLISNMLVESALPFVTEPIKRSTSYARGGWTTEDILRVITTANLNDAEYVFIESGINDMVFGKDEQIIPNYRLILNAVPKNKKIRLIGMLPLDDDATPESRKPALQNFKVKAKNEDLVALCNEYSHCKPVLRSMRNSNVGKTYDGLHLNISSYREFSEYLAASLD